MPGIFNWAYEGYKRLQEQKKFTETPEQSEMMEEFVLIMNPVAAFIKECLADEDGRLDRGELYRRYVEWAKEAGHETQSRTKFIQNFKKTAKQICPYVKEIKVLGVRCFDFTRDLRPLEDFIDE